MLFLKGFEGLIDCNIPAVRRGLRGGHARRDRVKAAAGNDTCSSLARLEVVFRYDILCKPSRLPSQVDIVLSSRSALSDQGFCIISLEWTCN